MRSMMRGRIGITRKIIQILTVSCLLVLPVIGLCGCTLLPKQTIVLGGIDDIVEVEPGAKVCGVTLPTDEQNKTYCIVTTKSMRLVSMDAWKNLEKYHG